MARCWFIIGLKLVRHRPKKFLVRGWLHFLKKSSNFILPQIPQLQLWSEGVMSFGRFPEPLQLNTINTGLQFGN
jgi:hypothetical protein